MTISTVMITIMINVNDDDVVTMTMKVGGGE